MQPFSADRVSRLERLYLRFDHFLDPLAEIEGGDLPVIARVQCQFGCSLNLTVVPSEWQTYRAGQADSIDSALPSSAPSDRVFLTTGYCPACWIEMQPTDLGDAK